MLLNRVLCVIGLYFSPFNDGLIVCVYVCVSVGVFEWTCCTCHINNWRTRKTCIPILILKIPLEISRLAQTITPLITAFNLDMFDE